MTGLAHQFWYRPEDVPTFTYPSGWAERIVADRRRNRIAAWGVVTPATWAREIATKVDWPYVCVQVPAWTRYMYEHHLERGRPLSSVFGYNEWGPFVAHLDDLVKLWRADSARKDAA